MPDRAALEARIRELTEENERLRAQLAAIKIVERAKRVLIQYLRLTEAEAHRHIVKRAMDTRRSAAEVAKDIISTYEN